MGRQRVAQFAYAAGGQQTIEISKFPTRGPMGFAYLTDLEIFVDVTDVDTGAGGVTTEEEFNDLISGVTVEALGGYVGPRALSGSDLQAVYAACTGRGLGFVEDEGDVQLAASQSNAIRQLYYDFPYWAFGAEDGDFSPLISALAEGGGRVTINMSALPTNATGVVATIYVYATYDEVREVRAVPLLVVERKGVDNTTGGTLGRGRLLLALLKNAADWADGDIDALNLRADGVAVLSSDEPSLRTSKYGFIGNGGATTPGDAKLYNHGIDPIDTATTEGDPRFIVVYPEYKPGMKVSKCHEANNWTYDITGAETAANMTWITAFSPRLAIGKALDQIQSVGIPRAALEAEGAASPEKVFRVKTASKVDGARGDLWGHLPVKVSSKNLLKHVGLA